MTTEDQETWAGLGTNAQVWAKDFMKIWGNRLDEIDEDLMIGWFANAIETARNAGIEQGRPKWINVKERLPEIGQSVALINVNAWENGPVDRNIYACGYLWQGNNYRPYWSVVGERGLSLEQYTHWMPLPELPKEEGECEPN